MATINLGAIKFNWKGAYNSGTSYAVDDVVSSGGSSYVCIQAHSNQAVGNATAYWNIMSSAGTDADLLNITSTAQGDIYYNNGSAIARLGAGTSGQFLKTQGTSANPVWGTVSAGTYSVHAISKYNYHKISVLFKIYLTVLNNLSYLICNGSVQNLLSLKSVSIENQINHTFPMIFSFGTKPTPLMTRLSEELSRLSPMKK